VATGVILGEYESRFGALAVESVTTTAAKAEVAAIDNGGKSKAQPPADAD